MSNENDYLTMDRRLVTRLVRKGMLNEREVEKALKPLPDLQQQAIPIETRPLEEDDIEDDG